MTHLSLFTGINGFGIAAGWAGFDTVAFSEIDPYCYQLLKEKYPETPNYGDINTADFSGLRGQITVLSAGVPCQPASLAGKGLGEKDDRWLWPQAIGVVEVVQPDWCIFENPTGIFRLGEFESILLRLEAAGYEVASPFQVPANAVGADHLRYRVFIVANAGSRRCDRQGERQDQQSGRTETIISSQTLANSKCINGERRSAGRREANECGSFFTTNGSSNFPETLADSDTKRLEELQSREPGQCETAIRGCGTSRFRLTQPPLCGRADGIRHRAHRLKALGNSVVPQQAHPFFQAIAEVERGLGV